MLVKKLHEDYLPAHTARFERRAASNGAQEGWIHGDKVINVTHSRSLTCSTTIILPNFFLFCSSPMQTLLPTCYLTTL